MANQIDKELAHVERKACYERLMAEMIELGKELPYHSREYVAVREAYAMIGIALSLEVALER